MSTIVGRPGAATSSLWPFSNTIMAARVWEHDWSTTALGAIATWSDELKFAVALVLDNHFPAALVWGSALTTIYNDAFQPILGDKPDSLGRSFADIWGEAWHDIGPIANQALRGQSTFIHDFPLALGSRSRLTSPSPTVRFERPMERC
jgi:hypothetical protein